MMTFEAFIPYFVGSEILDRLNWSHIDDRSGKNHKINCSVLSFAAVSEGTFRGIRAYTSLHTDAFAQ